MTDTVEAPHDDAAQHGHQHHTIHSNTSESRTAPNMGYIEQRQTERPVTKTMLRYPGGKTRAIKKLAPLIPAGTQHVVSPFLGGGSFELYLTGQGITVDASDLFAQLATFWQVMQRSPYVLAESVQSHLGDVEKTVFQALQQRLRAWSDDRNLYSEMEIATWFYIVNRCSFSGATLSGGYSPSAATQRFTQSSIDRVRSFTNDFITVTHGDYRQALDRDADLYYLDPPYLLGGARDSLYGDRGNMHDSFDHVEFRDRVKSLQKPTLITYNNTDAVRELWEDQQWSVQSTSWSYGMNDSKQSSEVLITNYDLGDSKYS